MNHNEVYSSLRSHIHTYFDGHKISEHQWTIGPTAVLFPQFRVAEISPGKRSGLWTYISVGAWEIRNDGSLLEFMIIAEKSDMRQVELLTMNAYYNQDHILQPGDVYPIGEPWIEGSNCDYMLISLPYTYGPELEICSIGDSHIHIYWLLPITANENEYRHENGVEALEVLFEEKSLDYWKYHRKSLV